MTSETYEQWRARCLNVHALAEGLQKIKAPRTELERLEMVHSYYRRHARPGMSLYDRTALMDNAERAILPVGQSVADFAPPTHQNAPNCDLHSDFPIGVPVAENASKSHPEPILANVPYQEEQVVTSEPQDRRSEIERDRYGIPTSYKNKSVDVLLEHLSEGDIYTVEKRDQYRHYAGEERIAILSISPRIEDKTVFSWGEQHVDRYRLAWVCHEDGRKELVKLCAWLSHYRVVGGPKLHAAQDTRNVLIPFKLTTPVWKGEKAA